MLSSCVKIILKLLLQSQSPPLPEIPGSHGGECEDDLSSGLLRRVVCKKFTDISEVLTATE
jgi:hypothetical protein